MTFQFRRALDNITRVSGVRGAMLVAGDDGLVVAESLMEGVRGNAVAALAASLAKRLRQTMGSVAAGGPQFLHLQGDEGTLIIVPAPNGILVVAIGSPEMNVGLARLEMLRAAETVT
jgi:predicted regulator of Ras-like GTPase activity (Roadblock/LC7/MglB family)